MPVKLSEIRKQFPMYADVPDDQLLIGLHRKFYSDLPFSKFNAQIEYDNKIDATDGMSSIDKFAAGVGKSVYDTARGIGQAVGVVDRGDVAESRKLDADLNNTTAGSVGQFVGDVATTVPLAFVPGANTVKGASLIGSAYGLLRPSASTEETVKNTAFGGAAGGGSILAGRALAAGYQGATGLLRPLTKSGQQEIAAEVLQRSATAPAKAAANIAKARPLVPGSAPTVAQIADDPGLAQLERSLINNPETAGPLQQVYSAQRAAREKAVSNVAGSPHYRGLIEEGRDVFARQDFADAFAQGIDQNMAKALKPQIDSLMRRPSMLRAQSVAKRLAAEQDQALTDFGSLEGMDWLKKALDNQISKASQPGSSIGKADLRALVQTKDDLMKTLEQIAPAYKVANDNFAKMSRQVNAQDVAAHLQGSLYKNAQYGAGNELGSTYRNELAKAVESIKKPTGMNMELADVMPTQDIAALESVARDLVRKEAAQNLGKASGSPTMQNMLSQNLLQRIAGPLGVPESFAQNALAQTLARPYGFAVAAGQQPINTILAEAMTNPALANQLLSLAPAASSKLGRAALGAERFLPVPGLLAIGNGN